MIYVASSWRNVYYPEIVITLKNAGYDLYDFRHPVDDNNGFHWEDIDPNWQHWTLEEYREALNHPRAVEGFAFDMNALEACERLVCVLPCGRSAHLELGHAIGQEKETFLWFPPNEYQPPDLMYKAVTHFCFSTEELLEKLGGK